MARLTTARPAATARPVRLTRIQVTRIWYLILGSDNCYLDACIFSAHERGSPFLVYQQLASVAAAASNGESFLQRLFARHARWYGPAVYRLRAMISPTLARHHPIHHLHPTATHLIKLRSTSALLTRHTIAMASCSPIARRDAARAV